jgi:putative hemolysin
MSNVVFQIAVIVLLILLNGFFAMSETALVSSRKARLSNAPRKGTGERGLRWSWPTRQTASSPRCRSESR